MTKTSKTVIAVIAAVILGWLVISLYGGGVAEAKERVTSHERHGNLVFTTWVDPKGSFCPGSGVLRGWIIKHRQDPGGIHFWTYGPWSGSYCSTNSKIQSVSWGGEPDGSVNPLMGWRWVATDSRIVNSDNAGSFRYRKWRGHFKPPVTSTFDRWPWLYVSISAGGPIGMDNGAG